MSELTEKQVEFISLKENIDPPPKGRFMLTVFGALAEPEWENIPERQREGIEIAKSEGKYKGLRPLEVDKAQFKDACRRWRSGEITATAAMQEVGLRPNTFYRRVKEMGLQRSVKTMPFAQLVYLGTPFTPDTFSWLRT